MLRRTISHGTDGVERLGETSQTHPLPFSTRHRDDRWVHSHAEREAHQERRPSHPPSKPQLTVIHELQRSAGNAAVTRLLQREDTEQDRFSALQQSGLYERDPDVSSMRNYLIDLYEQLAAVPPETYIGNTYPDVLPPSATRSNYSAAAKHTAQTQTNNRTRWALQGALVQYALTHGYAEMVKRAQDSTEFSYQIHEAAFQFAADQPTIGRLPWMLLTKIDVPALGEEIGSVIYGPEAFLEGCIAGMEALGADPMNTGRANAAFHFAYSASMRQKYTVGGRIINASIESLNSPDADMAWWQWGVRHALDAASWASAWAYD